MLEQPVNNEGSSRIQFLLNELYQEYKNVLLSFWGPESFISFFGARTFHFLKYKNFFQGRFFLIFLSLGLNVAQVAAYITTVIAYQIN